MRFSKSSAVAAAILLPFAAAQTSTSCNPLDTTCPSDPALNSASITSDFTKGSSAFSASWTAAQGTTLTYGKQGAQFTIAQAGQAPTVQTNFYIFFGRVDVKMRAAPGAGIVSSIVLLSDDLDEIDWEFLGGNTTTVETNFFGKGNTTVYDRAIYYPVSTPQDTFHTYSVDWNSDRIEWIIDGKTVRILKKNNPLTIGGTQYPQTPMRVKLGSWCGGCSGNSAGTISWAGGPTTFSGAPYDMFVESVTIQNYNPATSYQYTGHSGTWQSIKVNKAKGKSGSSPTKRGISSAAVPANSTIAPSSSAAVIPLSGTGAVVSSTIVGGNFTVKPTGMPTGTRGVVKTRTSLATIHAGGSGAASATPKAGTQNSAAALSIMSSTTLFGVLFSFFLL